MADKLTGSEAVYGFVAWLTTRDGAITMSRKHDASEAANLIAEFCETNGLPDPREDWTKNLTHPA